MIKTLRITSVIAILLAAVLVFLPAVFGFRRDEEVEKLLGSVGAVEKFSKEAGENFRRDNQITPLVSQAQKFADYLNPPVVEQKKPDRELRRTISAPKKPAVSSKFELVGTSFYPLHPEQSLALIDEPGKGLNWVRQGSKVGHSTIEQIKDGLVVVNDGGGTYELAAQREQRPSLVKSDSNINGGLESDSLRPAQSSSRAGSPRLRSVEAGSSSAEASLAPGREDINDLALMEMLITGLKSMKDESQQTNRQIDDVEAAQIDEFIAQLETETSRVTDKEAEQLDGLAKELEADNSEPNKEELEPNQPNRTKLRGADTILRHRARRTIRPVR